MKKPSDKKGKNRYRQQRKESRERWRQRLRSDLRYAKSLTKPHEREVQKRQERFGLEPVGDLPKGSTAPR